MYKHIYVCASLVASIPWKLSKNCNSVLPNVVALCHMVCLQRIRMKLRNVLLFRKGLHFGVY